MHYLKSYEMNKKKDVFVKITQTYHLMADVVAFFGKIFIPNLITKN